MTVKRDENTGQFVKGTGGGPGRPSARNELRAIFGTTEPIVKVQTECEVRERFRILNAAFNFFVVERSQEGFPDFLLRTHDGIPIRAECEKSSCDFRSHKHDVSACDLIICWKHVWEECPIPVFPIAGIWSVYLHMRKTGIFQVLSSPVVWPNRDNVVGDGE